MHNKLFFIFLAFTISSCAFSQKKTDGRLSAVKLSFEFPVLNPTTGKIVVLKDSVNLYYLENMTLLRERYTSTTYKNNVARNDSTVVVNDIPENVASKTSKYFYYIYANGSGTGFKYDSLSNHRFKKIDIDSLLRKKTFKGARFYADGTDKLISTTKELDGTVKEVYVPITKKDMSYPDTTYFKFDPKFMNVVYSLSKELEEKKNMRVVEVRMIYNAIPKSDLSPIEIPKKMFVFKLEEVNARNDTDVSKVFDLFQKSNIMRLDK